MVSPEVKERMLKKKICMKCGTKNAWGAKKCRKCGSSQLRPKKAEKK